MPGTGSVRRRFGTYEIDPVKKQIRIQFQDAKGTFDTWDFNFDRDRLVIDTKTLPPGVTGTSYRRQFERPATKPEPAKDGKP